MSQMSQARAQVYQTLYHELDLSVALIAELVGVSHTTITKNVIGKKPIYSKALIEELTEEYRPHIQSKKYINVRCHTNGSIIQLRSFRGQPPKYYKVWVNKGFATILHNGKFKRLKADHIVYNTLKEYDPRTVCYHHIDGNLNNCAIDNLVPKHTRSRDVTVDRRYEIARHIDTLSPEEAHTLYDEELSSETVERMLLKKIYFKLNVTPEVKESIRSRHIKGAVFRDIKREFSEYKITQLQEVYKKIRYEIYE
jgi:hypothetical protein